jgi:hypothetical protein
MGSQSYVLFPAESPWPTGEDDAARIDNAQLILDSCSLFEEGKSGIPEPEENYPG